MSAPPERQFALDLRGPVAYGAADFLVAGCNGAAIRWIEQWPNWQGAGLVLHGPAGSGKSHLAHVWAARSGARYLSGKTLDEHTLENVGAIEGSPVVVDDATDVADERILLHLYNLVWGGGAHFMVVAGEPPARWGIALPDLRSRLCALPAVGIGAPDDAVLAAMLVKQFDDRQLRVGEDVIDYLLKRMPRSFAAAGALVDAIDREALDRHRAVTVPLSRDVLNRHFNDAWNSRAVVTTTSGRK